MRPPKTDCIFEIIIEKYVDYEEKTIKTPNEQNITFFRYF